MSASNTSEPLSFFNTGEIPVHHEDHAKTLAYGYLIFALLVLAAAAVFILRKLPNRKPRQRRQRTGLPVFSVAVYRKKKYATVPDVLRQPPQKMELPVVIENRHTEDCCL
ncbi:hypothetical protein QR680_000506 [Steinernema hermaphroditum]|uniref:Uncharacterized protein n=1 Tax=Steinernema hermaphroditum TaxID=289476 RepID=A0AA39GUU9_9BILA|nr:hypothetical protein QR680_000506 [Steinernema hermaphroditum]